MRILRTTKNRMYVYHVGETYPRGPVNEIRLWRSAAGYFAEITHRERAVSIPFDAYKSWGDLRRDLKKCVYEDLEYPEFDEESELKPPLLRRISDNP